MESMSVESIVSAYDQVKIRNKLLEPESERIITLKDLGRVDIDRFFTREEVRRVIVSCESRSHKNIIALFRSD